MSIQIKLPLDVSYRGMHKKLTRLEPFVNGEYNNVTDDAIIHELEETLKGLKRALAAERKQDTLARHGICHIAPSLMGCDLCRGHVEHLTGGTYLTGFWWFWAEMWRMVTPEQWYSPRIRFIKMLINFYKRKQHESKNKIKN
jgi:hypothetical protein